MTLLEVLAHQSNRLDDIAKIQSQGATTELSAEKASVLLQLETVAFLCEILRELKEINRKL